jgi:FkbM family methyltransferase
MPNQDLKGKINRALYHSPLRSVLRRLRVFHWLLKLAGGLKSCGYRLLFIFHKGDIVKISLSGQEASFASSSFVEFKRIMALGSEKKIIEPFLGKVAAGDVVFDIGASVGLYAVFLAKKVGDKGLVVAFEPELQSRERLLEDFRINSLGNVKVFKDGLGSEEGKQFLVPDTNFASGAHGVFKERSAGSDPKRTTEINIFTGDGFIRQNSLPTPNVLKVDVEGMEWDVLSGLTETIKKPDCRLILCEVHFSQLEKRGMPEAPKWIEELLGKSGFNDMTWLDHSHLMAGKQR